MGFEEGFKRGVFRVVTTLLSFYAILGSGYIYWEYNWKYALANLVITGAVIAFLQGYSGQWIDED